MIYFLFFSFYSLLFVRRRTIAFYIILFFLCSSFFGIVIGNVPEMNSFLDFFNIVYTLFILCLFCTCFKNYRLYDVADPINIRAFKFLLVFLSLSLVLSFVINLLIIYKSFSYIMISGADITSFKNDGEAAILIRQWVDPNLVRFANFASPLGLLALAFHFYYLIKVRLYLSLFFLLLSLNVPLAGLHGLSRSGIVQFILMYAFFYLYSYPAISGRVRLKINFFVFLILSSVLLAFYYITNARFSGSYSKSDVDEGIIENRAIYSIFDYFSQWSVNGITVMGNFSLEKIWYGKSSRTFLDEVLARSGMDMVSYVELRKLTLDDNASSFNGLVATLLYDFGYAGAIAFSLLFYFFVRFLSPKRGEVQFHNFVCFGSLITLPALFFTNNYLSNTLFSVGVFYTMLAFFILRYRFSIRDKCKIDAEMLDDSF